VNINDVSAEVGAKIVAAEIGLRVLAWDADSISPPGVLFALPSEYEYDKTYGRGSDEFTLPIVVLVGKADARSARTSLGLYLNGSGPKSLKSIVDSSRTNTYTSCDTVRVQQVSDIGPYVAGSISYLGATLDTRITGKGA
jgi:hypothetical protein